MTISPSAVARVVGVEAVYDPSIGAAGARQLPQRVAIVGQGNTLATYATTPVVVQTAVQVGNTFGFGSPLHLSMLEVRPSNGDGVGSIPVTLYPMVDDGAGAAALGDIEPIGTQVGADSYIIDINGVRSAPFVIDDGELPATIAPKIVAAINGNVSMPMIAVAGIGNVTDLTAKWKGVSTNDLTVSVIGTISGITFTITDPVGGLVNPDVTATLAQIVDVWETMVVNCLEYTDTTTLDLYETWGEGRWDALTQMPAVVFVGTNEATLATLTAAGDLRKSDRVNALVTVVGSNSLPLQIAARGVARIVERANTNPPRDYPRLRLNTIDPGTDAQQWSYLDRDAAVTAGVSTGKVVDGVPVLSDVVTFYHPDGETPPAYRHVVDIVKLQQVIYNAGLIFNSEEWDGAPLIADDQVTNNPDAKSPKDAIAALNTMIDALAADAVLTNPDIAKPKTTAVLGGPKRLNMGVTVQLSGNANIMDVQLNFGFDFGG